MSSNDTITITKEELQKIIADEVAKSTKQSVISPITGKPVVTITSLCDKLELTTKSKGGGTQFSFGAFGETQELDYVDVQSILNVKHQNTMAKNLRFIIDNEDLIKRFRLGKIYDIIKPNVDDFDNILACNKTRIIEIMSNASQKLRDSLFRRSVSTFKREGNNLDYNKLLIIQPYFPKEKKLHTYFEKDNQIE